MLTTVVLCLATLCWPTTPARTRLHTLTSAERPRRLRHPHLSAPAITVASAVAGWLLAALPGAAAAALATATVQRRWRARGSLTRSLAATEGLAEAIRSLVAGLRTGAHPAAAIESAAVDAHPSAAAPMRALAAAARLDGDLTRAMSPAAAPMRTVAAAARFDGGPTRAMSPAAAPARTVAVGAGLDGDLTWALSSTATPARTVAAAARFDGDLTRALSPAATPVRTAAGARLDGDLTRELSPAPIPTALARISRAWALAQRHGLPLADVLEASARDLDQRVRFARQVQARMAGPRTSATVLAVLPALGMALGQAMGARPLHVLTAAAQGRLLLLLGVALLCAGVTWCARLTNQAVSP